MIAFLIFSGSTFGGAERRYARLAAYLSSIGVEITLYCTADAWGVIEQLQIPFPGNRVKVIDNRSTGHKLRDKLNRALGLLCFFSAIRRTKPGRVFLAMNPGLIASVYGLLSSWLPTYAVAMVDSTVEEKPENTLIRRLQFRLSVLNAGAVDCLSEAIKRLAISKLNGRELTQLHVAPCSFTDLNKVQTAAERDIDVLFLGRFANGKGLDLLQDAVPMIASPDPVIHVCGSGPLRPNVPVAHVYHSTDSFATMARAKVFLSIQRNENYPSQSLLEAMGSSCAIIATDVGETRRLLDDTCAVLVPPDPRAIALAITDLLHDEARRAKLGAAACHRVHSAHSVGRYAEYFLLYICPKVKSRS